jgi:hypothetical protein
VFKFKPKRGYRRRTGHRQDLTRIEVTEIKQLSRKPAAKKADNDAEPAPAKSGAAASGKTGAAAKEADE